VLTAANTYAYATTISASALLDRSRSAGMTANGTLDISGTTSGASIAGLSGSGAVTLGAQTLTPLSTNASGSFAGTNFCEP